MKCNITCIWICAIYLLLVYYSFLHGIHSVLNVLYVFVVFRYSGLL